MLLKKIILIALCSVLCGSGLNAAYKKTLTTNPFTLLNLDIVNLKYEQMLGKKNSFTAEFAYDYGYDNTMGLNLTGAYRWYIRNLIPIKTSGIEGFSVAPWVNLGLYRYEVNSDNTDNDFVLNIGGEVAYKWVFFGGLTVEPSIRLGFHAVKPGYYNTGIYFDPGISIGYAW
jgi:hypothetical protein